MSGFDFDPPKRVGPVSQPGEGRLRGLHDTHKELPYSKSVLVNATAFKNEIFDKVVNAPEDPESPRIFLEGRLSGEADASAYVGGSTRGSFVLLDLAVVGGEEGAVYIGAGASAVVLGFLSGGQFKIWRSFNLQSKTEEYTSFSNLPVGNFVYLVGGFRTHNDGVEYEAVNWSGLDGGTLRTAPFAVYCVDGDGTWAAASIPGYADYDHWAKAEGQIDPLTRLIAYAVIPKGHVFPLEPMATESPTGQVPYPLFLASTDGGATYTPFDLDFMFTGSYDAFSYVSGGATTTGNGGMNIVSSMLITRVIDSVFISFSLRLDSPPIDEVRIFRFDGLDLNAGIQIDPPPGYNEIWTGAPIIVFGSPVGTGLQGTIGYVVLANEENRPAMIFVSENLGATWSAPRLLPCIQRFGATVRPVAEDELWLSVYEPIPSPQVVHYASTDFGLTWERRQVIATGIAAVDPFSGNLEDFRFPVVLNNPKPVTPGAHDPMYPSNYDTRIPLRIRESFTS